MLNDNVFRAAQLGADSGGHGNQQVRGPLSGMLCSLHRKGWTFASPTSLLTHDGSIISLLLVSPAAFKSRVRSAMAFQGQRDGYGDSVSVTPSSRGQVEAMVASVFMGEPIQALRKAVTPLEKACLRLAACGRGWRSRLLNKTSTLRAPLCGEGIDTEFHCVWACRSREIAAARLKISGSKLSGRRAGPAPLAVHGGQASHALSARRAVVRTVGPDGNTLVLPGFRRACLCQGGGAWTPPTSLGWSGVVCCATTAGKSSKPRTATCRGGRARSDCGLGEGRPCPVGVPAVSPTSSRAPTRQADVRLRRIYTWKHPTRSALVDGIPLPLGLSHHARRAAAWFARCCWCGGWCERLLSCWSHSSWCQMSSFQRSSFCSHLVCESLTILMTRSTASMKRRVWNVGCAKPQLRRSTRGSTLPGADKLSAHFRATGRGTPAKTTPTPRSRPCCAPQLLHCKFAVCISMPPCIGERARLLRGAEAP